MYGNPLGGLYYESNRGDYCEHYYKTRGKISLLCLRPQNEEDIEIKMIPKFGINMNNRIDKIAAIDDTNDWLLSETTYNGNKKKVIFTIPDLFTIRQIIPYDIDLHDTFDAISSMILVPTAFRQIEKRMAASANRKKTNRLIFLSQNEQVFYADQIINQGFRENLSGTKQSR